MQWHQADSAASLCLALRGTAALRDDQRHILCLTNLTVAFASPLRGWQWRQEPEDHDIQCGHEDRQLHNQPSARARRAMERCAVPAGTQLHAECSEVLRLL